MILTQVSILEAVILILMGCGVLAFGIFTIIKVKNKGKKKKEDDD